MTVKSNKPTHRIYAVRKTGKDTSFWADIGAAWLNQDGKGLNLKFNLMPVGEADIVLREITSDGETEGGSK